jgi:hypothetical protein
VIALVFLAVGLALAGWAARALWRRDSYGAAQFLLFCFALPALVAALWGFNTGSSAAWTIVGLFMVPVLACGAHIYRDRMRPEVLPNILLQWAPTGSVCELNELQFAAQLVPLSSTAGMFELRIAVQSCVDAERMLVVTLSGPSASRLWYRPRATVRVGAGEVGILSLPLVSVPGAGVPGKLHFAPDVSGAPGARVRYWRAQPYQKRIDPTLQALLLVGGTIAWGGGWSVNVPEWTGPGEPSGELPPDRWTVEWKPEAALLASARLR